MSGIFAPKEQMEKRMRSFHRISLFILTALFFTACSTSGTSAPPLVPADNPFEPQAGDNTMALSDVLVNSAFLNLQQPQESVLLGFSFYKEAACDQLRVSVSQPDAKKQINVSVYAVREKDKPCTLANLRAPIQANVILGSYPKGHYSVYVNGVKAGEFDS
jgi:hypothetical protein